MKNLINFYTLTLFVIISAVNVSAKSIVTDGLVSYWTFDKHTKFAKKVFDKWGDITVTIRGNPQEVTGYLGEALEFNGLNEYIDLTNLGEFGKNVGTSTIEAWVKAEHNAGEMTLFDVQDECMKWGLSFISNKTGDKDNIKHISGIVIRDDNELPGDLCQGFGETFIIPSITDGIWHHIVYTSNIVEKNALGVSKFQRLRIYLDTKQVNRGSLRALLSPKFIRFIKPVILGASKRNGPAAHFFKGKIDELRIYNRPLTRNEIIQNFESKVGLGVEPADKISTIWGKLKTRF